MRMALDQNFPEPVFNSVKPWTLSIQLVPLRRIDSRLTTLEDRKLLIALKQFGYDGLVTLNYKMLRNPTELAAVLKTKLVILAIEGVGNDPIRATGALLLYLQPAVKAMQSGRTGVFWLRPRAPQARKPWDLFQRAADHYIYNALNNCALWQGSLPCRYEKAHDSRCPDGDSGDPRRDSAFSPSAL